MKKSIFLAASILLSLTLCIKSQTISIDSTFTSDAEIFPFNQNDTINGLRISGSVTLNSDTSLVRVIFTDDLYDEYMIWEAYSLIVSQNSFSFENVYDETYCLDQLDPYSIRIEIINASFTLESVYMLEEACNNAENDRYTAKRAMDAKKIDTMNLRVKEYGMNWIANDNTEVALYYQDKVNIYGTKYNLRGFDYYQNGVFELLGYRNYQSETSSFVRYFDWRTRHDASDTSSMYWDGEYDGSGWLTKKSNQGSCGACWVFGPVAVLEGIINLYFNQHLDFDLSEQYLFSCSDDRLCEQGGFASVAIDYALEHGAKTENCFPYYIDTLAHEYSCGDTCDFSDTLVNAEERLNINNDNDSVKIALIKYGPLSSSIPISNDYHVLSIIGYRTNWSDTVTIWICKDSRSGTDNFIEIKNSSNLLSGVYAINNPVSIYDSDTSNHYSQLCYDKDDDGYYWWGIGPKPDTCPTCPDQRDSNDNDPFFGSYDSCYNETCNYQYNSQAIHITSDTTWDSAMIVQNTVYVDSGYSLTIRSEVKFVEHSGIVVKQGGKLNIYGGRLTKACHELWKGIKVWGHYDTTQNFSGIQGIIKIDSNSLIEYAEIGVMAGCRDIDPQEMYPYLRAGGIIIAKNSKFLNNTIDVEFQPYQNIHPYNPKQELSNASHFYNCIFETNNNDYYYYPPDKHLVLSEVKDIDILGCTFKGTHPDSLNAEADRYRGYGIYSTGSSFFVDNYCWSLAYPCPDSCKITSSFKNLNYGIYALDWNTSRLIKIDSAEFSNNICGAYFSGISNLSCTFNTFDLQPRHAEKNDTICGLYLESCTGYFIEENVYQSNYVYHPILDNRRNYIGLYIKNSGTANNEIYNNYFNNNYYATIVEGVNRGDTTGLCIKCNDYRYNLNDIFVVPDTSIRNLRLEQGIAEYQGSVSDTTTTGPAGNTFTVFEDDPDSVKIKYFNYLNDTTEYFNYLHHNYNRDNPRIYPENVNDSTELIIFHYMNENYTKAISCPSSFTGGGGIEELKSSISYEELLIGQLQTDLSANVDGGNTNELLDDIETSNPSQSNALRQQLMDNSPYLTDTVISLSIEKETVLPNPFLRDIISANPHAARKERHMEQIDERNVNMPEYMKEQIRESKYNLDILDLLKSEKQLRENKKDKYLNSMIRKYLSDTSIENPHDSIIMQIQDEAVLIRKIQKSYAYLAKDDTVSARSSLASISSELDLDVTEDSIVSGFSKLMDILIAQKAKGVSNLLLDSNTTVELNGLRNTKLPLISVYAENLLAANNKLRKKEKYFFPGSANLKSRKIVFPENEDNIQNEYLKLIPNPTNANVLLDYEVELQVGYDLVLKVFNVTGVEIYSNKLNYRKGQYLLNTDTWYPGIYFIVLKTDSKNQIEKLILTK